MIDDIDFGESSPQLPDGITLLPSKDDDELVRERERKCERMMMMMTMI